MASKTSHERSALERLVRYALDTAPHEYGLVPEDGGWFHIKELLAAIRDEDGFRKLTEGRLMELVNQPGGVSPLEAEDGRVRIKPPLQKGPPPLPADLALPKELWVALKPASWRAASTGGLLPRRPRETRVPLFADRGQALKVAGRFCPDPVAVKVLAAKARDGGVIFSPFAETLWLADEVPAGFLSGPPVKPPEEAEAPKKGKGKAAAPESQLPEIPGVFPPSGTKVHSGKLKGRRGDSPDWKNQTRRDRRGGKGDRDR